MDLRPEVLANHASGSEFLAGEFGGMDRGVMAVHRLDIVRIPQQQPRPASAPNSGTTGLKIELIVVSSDTCQFPSTVESAGTPQQRITET